MGRVRNLQQRSLASYGTRIRSLFRCYNSRRSRIFNIVQLGYYHPGLSDQPMELVTGLGSEYWWRRLSFRLPRKPLLSKKVINICNYYKNHRLSYYYEYGDYFITRDDEL